MFRLRFTYQVNTRTGGARSPLNVSVMKSNGASFTYDEMWSHAREFITEVEKTQYGVILTLWQEPVPR